MPRRTSRIVKTDPKQQSALEFLVTYAWAFLIIAIAIVVIAVFAVRPAPSSVLPSQCNVQPLIPCQQTLLTASSSNTPIQFKVLMVNNLAPYIYVPANGFVVTTTNLGSAGTNNYTGGCSPSLIPQGSQMLCQASIPGTVAPSVGSLVNLPFVIKYQVCSTSNVIACTSPAYSSAGYSTQSLSFTSQVLYNLTLASNVNTIIAINNQRYLTGTSIHLLGGKYTAFAVAPSGYQFSSWQTQNGVTAVPSTSQNTTITLTGNSTLTATFTTITISTTVTIAQSSTTLVSSTTVSLTTSLSTSTSVSSTTSVSISSSSTSISSTTGSTSSISLSTTLRSSSSTSVSSSTSLSSTTIALVGCPVGGNCAGVIWGSCTASETCLPPTVNASGCLYNPCRFTPSSTTLFSSSSSTSVSSSTTLFSSSSSTSVSSTTTIQVSCGSGTGCNAGTCIAGVCTEISSNGCGSTGGPTYACLVSSTTLLSTTTGYYTCNACELIQGGYNCPNTCTDAVSCGANKVDCEVAQSTTLKSTTTVGVTSLTTLKSTTTVGVTSLTTLKSTTTVGVTSLTTLKSTTTISSTTVTVVTGSFVGPTEVLMADGSWKSMQDIKPGDVIESYNPATNKMYPNVVISVPVYTTNVLITINNQLTTDGFEVFYVNSSGAYQWMHASDLKVGDRIRDPLTGTDIPVVTLSVRNAGNHVVPIYDILGTSGNDYIVSGGYLADKVT